ncbi:hypothetical protein H4219_001469 [Mycoemilia scoparia]|uniref:Chloride channel protein n=1 Tax=Mycoemilia scoparia TaxID=417184 RepID=A0A9W8A3G4_9FUNG|nr:hypothetical protein H4219_001469 [Mycoemilia scoparia]
MSTPPHDSAREGNGNGNGGGNNSDSSSPNDTGIQGRPQGLARRQSSSGLGDLPTINEHQALSLGQNNQDDEGEDEHQESRPAGGFPISQSTVTSPAVGPEDGEPIHWELGRTITTQSHPVGMTGIEGTNHDGADGPYLESTGHTYGSGETTGYSYDIDDLPGAGTPTEASHGGERAPLLSRGASFQSRALNRLSMWMPQRRRGRYDDYNFSSSRAGAGPSGSRSHGRKKRRVGGERVWYGSYTAIDWTHDAIKEQARLRALRRKTGWRGWWLNHVYDPSQGWILVILTGILCGLFAGFITEWTEWLSSLKTGLCVDDWRLGDMCCRDFGVPLPGNGTSMPTFISPQVMHAMGKDTCPGWKSWSQILGSGFTGGDSYLFDFASYTMWGLLFNFIASSMVVNTATDVVLAPGVTRSVAPSSMEVNITPTKKRAYYGAGSGLPEVKSILSGFVIHGFLGVRILFVKTFGLILCVASGIISGKEGPMVQIAASLGNISARLFDKYNRNESKKREIISAAAAAGVSVAFGAPIGGVLFSLEEVSYFFPNKTMLRSYFSALVAAIVLKMYDPLKTGKLVMFEVSYDMNFHWFELGFFVLIGIFGGLWGPFYNRFNMAINRLRKNTVLGRYPITEVLLVTSLTALASYHIQLTRVGLGKLVETLFSECHDDDDQMGLCVVGNTFEHYWPIITLLLVTLANRMFFAIITFGIRVPSGLVLPSMTIGAVFGRLVGTIVEYLYKTNPHWVMFSSCPVDGSRCVIPGLYALVGAGATLTGVTRTTISVAVILFELTGTLTYTLPVMVSIITAKWVADRFNPKGIYDLLIENAGHPFLETKTEYVFTKRTAGEVMESDTDIIQTHKSNTISKIERKLMNMAMRGYSDGGFPIVNSRGVLIGYIAYNEVEYALSLCQQLSPQTTCFFDNPLLNNAAMTDDPNRLSDLSGSDDSPRALRRRAPLADPDQFRPNTENNNSPAGNINDCSSDSTQSVYHESTVGNTLRSLYETVRTLFSSSDKKPLSSPREGNGGAMLPGYGSLNDTLSSSPQIASATGINTPLRNNRLSLSVPPPSSAASFAVSVPTFQEKPNDMTPYVDQAPTTVSDNTPIELVMDMFALMGVNYLCVTHQGQYRGIIFKKRFIGYLTELEEAGMTR